MEANPADTIMPATRITVSIFFSRHIFFKKPCRKGDPYGPEHNGKYKKDISKKRSTRNIIIVEGKQPERKKKYSNDEDDYEE